MKKKKPQYPKQILVLQTYGGLEVGIEGSTNLMSVSEDGDKVGVYQLVGVKTVRKGVTLE